MIAIPNMVKPESCTHCFAFTLQEAPTHYAYDEPPYIYPYCELLEREVDDDTIPNDCPLIEIGDIEYQAYKEFRTMLLKKIEEVILHGERK